jgi:phospholipid N-methyltransferase
VSEIRKQGELASSESFQEAQRLDATSSLVPDLAHTILEIGFYDGRLTRRIMSRGEVVALDKSIQADIKGVHLVQSSIDSMPFRVRSFDCVVCTEVLEHLPKNQYQEGLEEMAKTARKWILISVPLRERLEENRIFCPECGHSFHVWGHLRPFL